MSSVKHRSPSLTAIYNALKSNPKNSILDLGSFSVANFNFFSILGCHFHFLGINEIIPTLKAVDDAAFDIEVNKLFFDIDKSQQFDVVFGWDLLNFLTLEKAQSLVNKINPYLHADSLFCFFLYVGVPPKTPSKFTIEDQYFIQVQDQASLNEDSPHSAPSHLTSVALAKVLPDYFFINNYRSLSGMLPGIAEQILCFQPDALQHKKLSGSAEIHDAEQLVERVFNSPSINSIRSDQPQDAILDFCTKHLLNEDAWKRHFHHVHFADFPVLLERYEKSSAPEKKAYLTNGNFLTYAESTVFDVIVLWDFITFANTDFMEEIGNRLNKYCRDGTLLIVMSHTTTLVPLSSMRFLLTQSGIGLCAHQTPKYVARTKPVLSSTHIQKIFPNMYLKETFGAHQGMLKGVTEYIFVYKDSATLSREKELLKQQVFDLRQNSTGGIAAKH